MKVRSNRPASFRANPPDIRRNGPEDGKSACDETISNGAPGTSQGFGENIKLSCERPIRSPRIAAQDSSRLISEEHHKARRAKPGPGVSTPIATPIHGESLVPSGRHHTQYTTHHAGPA